MASVLWLTLLGSWDTSRVCTAVRHIDKGIMLQGDLKVQVIWDVRKGGRADITMANISGRAGF